jgi:hypothetical protein
LERAVTRALCFLVATAAWAQAPCPPGARVEGDPTAVPQVETALRTRGFDVQPRWECAALRVRVTAAGSRLAVEMEQGGRSDVVDAPDAETAGAALAAWSLGREATSVSEERVVFHLGAEAVADAVGALGGGVLASACHSLSVFCVGGTARYYGETDGSLKSSGFDFLLTVEHANHVGRMRLAPLLGVGTGARWDGDPANHIQWGIRLEAGASAALHFRGSWALEARLTGTWAPTAGESQPQAFVRLGFGVEWGLSRLAAP